MSHDTPTEPVLSKTQQKKLAALEFNKTVNRSESASLTLEQREELEALSKEVFGSTSRYATFMKKGETVTVTETVNEYVPDPNGGEGVTKETQVPVTLDRAKKSAALKTVLHTYDSVKTLMLDLKDRQEKFHAALAKAQADQVAAKLAKDEEAKKADLLREVQNKLGGSAV